MNISLFELYLLANKVVTSRHLNYALNEANIAVQHAHDVDE